MIIEPRRGRFWAYIDPYSNLGKEIMEELTSSKSKRAKRAIGWLFENVAGGWSASGKFFYRKEDDAPYLAVRFTEEDDAVMFALKFSENAPRKILNPPAWKSWDNNKKDNPTAKTFERNVNFWFIKSDSGEIFVWSTGKNHAGFYLTWRTVNGIEDEHSIMPWRKKRDAIAWARSSAEKEDSYR